MMEINESLVEYIAATYYNITLKSGSVENLYGYTDKNYVFTDASDNARYVLKIVHPNESHKELTDLIDKALDDVEKYLSEEGGEGRIITVPKLVSTTAARLSGFVTIRVVTNPSSSILVDEEAKLMECNFRLWRYFDGLTVFEFIQQHKIVNYRPKFYARIGRACNELFDPLASTLCHMTDTLLVLREKYQFAWDIMGCKSSQLIEKLDIVYPKDSTDSEAKNRRRLVEISLEQFELVRTDLQRLPQFVLHGDLGTRNMLLDRTCLREYSNGARDLRDEQRDICFIDFQDIQVGAQVVEVSNTLLYLIVEQDLIPLDEALLNIPVWFLHGYQSNGEHRLNVHHLNYTPSLMRLRLSQSLLNGLMANRLDPTNVDVLQTNQRGWQLLELLCVDNETRASTTSSLVSHWIEGQH